MRPLTHDEWLLDGPGGPNDRYPPPDDDDDDDDRMPSKPEFESRGFCAVCGEPADGCFCQEE